MTLINQVVQSAICSGYLTSEAEARLRQLTSGVCNLEDVAALSMLQQALSSGKVQYGISKDVISKNMASDQH